MPQLHNIPEYCIPVIYPFGIENSAAKSREFQQLSSDEKIRRMSECIELGWAALNASPHRELIEAWFTEQDNELRRIHIELIAQFERSNQQNV